MLTAFMGRGNFSFLLCLGFTPAPQALRHQSVCIWSVSATIVCHHCGNHIKVPAENVIKKKCLILSWQLSQLMDLWLYVDVFSPEDAEIFGWFLCFLFCFCFLTFCLFIGALSFIRDSLHLSVSWLGTKKKH